MTDKYHMCTHCKTGKILPIYRKDRSPKYRCTQCNQLHTPTLTKYTQWRSPGYHLTIHRDGSVAFG